MGGLSQVKLKFVGNYRTTDGSIAHNVTSDQGNFPFYGVIRSELYYFDENGHCYSSNVAGNKRIPEHDLQDLVRPGAKL